MRTRYLFTFLLLTGNCFAEQPAEATKAPASGPMECRLELSYQWKRAGEAETPQSVTVRGLAVKGNDEASAKAGLNVAKIAATREVMDACKNEHENMSSCLASKLEANTAVIQQLGFSARQKLESAIEADCKAAIGTCLSVKESEVTCVAPPAPTAAAEGGEKKKDPKAGKK